MSNNPDKARALEGYGVKVMGRVPLLMPARTENVAYLTTKRDRVFHTSASQAGLERSLKLVAAGGRWSN